MFKYRSFRPCARKYAQGAEVRFTSGSWKDVVHPSYESPNTLRRFVLGARDVYLVGENPTGSVPALYACEGLSSYDYGCALREYIPAPFFLVCRFVSRLGCAPWAFPRHV